MSEMEAQINRLKELQREMNTLIESLTRFHKVEIDFGGKEFAISGTRSRKIALDIVKRF